MLCMCYENYPCICHKIMGINATVGNIIMVCSKYTNEYIICIMYTIKYILYTMLRASRQLYVHGTIVNSFFCINKC